MTPKTKFSKFSRIDSGKYEDIRNQKKIHSGIENPK